MDHSKRSSLLPSTSEEVSDFVFTYTGAEIGAACRRKCERLRAVHEEAHKEMDRLEAEFGIEHGAWIGTPSSYRTHDHYRLGSQWNRQYHLAQSASSEFETLRKYAVAFEHHPENRYDLTADDIERFGLHEDETASK